MTEPATDPPVSATASEPPAPEPPVAAMDAAGAASFAAALGGPLGMAESSLPPIVYVAAYTISGQDAKLAAVVALALGVVLALARLARGQSPRFAVSGLAGTGLAAFVVSRTGNGSDFYLPGLIENVAFAAAYAISIVVRWPLVGVIVSSVQGQTPDVWRDDPALVRAYSRASWVWVGLFVLRLAVQVPLYLAGAVVVLGVVKVAMGVPLFAVGLWLSWLLLRTPQPAAAARN